MLETWEGVRSMPGRLSAWESGLNLPVLERFVRDRPGGGRAPEGWGLAPPGRATRFERNSERYEAMM